MKAFPKIFTMGTRHVASIFDEEVEVTEKVDGSQFAFGKIDNEIVMRSKGKIIVPDAPEKMFQSAVDFVQSIDKDRLPEGVVFYCEYLNKPKHNTLKYDRIPLNGLILFGIYDVRLDTMFSYYENLIHWATYLCIEPVPLIYTGKTSAQDVTKMIDRESVLGGCKVEGVVVKNYKDTIIADQVLPVQTAKYVSDAFKEVHRGWKKEHSGKGKWETFADGYRTNARWEKAIQHLAEANTLQGEPQDIGPLIKEIQRDIIEESKDEIMEYMWKTFSAELLRKSVAGFPEWYKDRLATSTIAA